MEPNTVLVAAPLIGRDAGLVPGWAAAVAAIAAARPGTAFIACAAVHESDRAAAGACRKAGVGVIEISRSAPSREQKKASVTLGRIRLVREAVARGADAIWFVDIDVRPRPEHWAAIDTLFRARKPAIIIPCPARWAPGRAPVVCLVEDGRPVLRDARHIRAPPGEAGPPGAAAASVAVAGGGFGCTALAVGAASTIPFIVREAVTAGGGLVGGEDVGWFLNAYRAGIEVRMPTGLIAEQVDGAGRGAGQ
jgi:hypothetical protein